MKSKKHSMIKKVNMKKSILMMLVFVMISVFHVHAQQVNIVVAIAKQKTSCNTSTDLGYSVQYGSGKVYELSKVADAEVKRHNPQCEWIDSRNDNVYMGNYLGSHMVIISAKTSGSDGCTRFTYGVGFGTDYNSALKDAKNFLSIKNLSWSEREHGYSVVKQKQY
jgi:predicted small secreted protein